MGNTNFFTPSDVGIQLGVNDVVQIELSEDELNEIIKLIV